MRSYRTMVIQDKTKHRHLDLFLRHPPALDRLSETELALIAQLVDRQRQTLIATEQKLCERKSSLKSKGKLYKQEKSPPSHNQSLPL